MNSKVFKSLIFYIIGVIFLYVSVLMSQYFKYKGDFVSAMPLIFPIIFALAFFSISVLFIMDRKYPWFFRTGIMSLVSGITLFIFGMISFQFKVNSIIWAGSLGIGVLFILAAIVRLIIQGGLTAYKKAKNQ